MIIEERYKPVVVGVNSTYTIPDGVQAIAGFACVTSGTLTVVNQRGVTILNAIPVTAGVYLPLPFYLETGSGGRATTAGGASGTLATT